MANSIKNQQDILAIENNEKTILLSPTGTGKTLAFLLPLLGALDPDTKEVQALIIVPSRELAIQIETVIRNMGSGYKVNAIYGGRTIAKDKIELKHTPAILIGTPGRLADHFEQARFATKFIKTLVIDEFDISIEVGAGGEMKFIMSYLANVTKRILTSATQGVSVPEFVKLNNPVTVNYLSEKVPSKLAIKTVISPDKNKLKTLLSLLEFVGNEPGIIFCNFRDSISEVSSFLEQNKISHTCFSGGMEQKDRERALIKFRNGSSQVLLATDLAARGIDIPEMKHIIHYELPIHKEEFIHRNGRTARVNAKGTAYVLKWKDQLLPDFILDVKGIDISEKAPYKPVYWQTLFISGGRKDKISKGDIAGLFFKQGELNKHELGTIELKQDCAFVAVPVVLANDLIQKLNNTRLKKKKVRVTIL